MFSITYLSVGLFIFEEVVTVFRVLGGSLKKMAIFTQFKSHKKIIRKKREKMMREMGKMRLETSGEMSQLPRTIKFDLSTNTFNYLS